jgi:hypothetical protein
LAGIDAEDRHRDDFIIVFSALLSGGKEWKRGEEGSGVTQQIARNGKYPIRHGKGVFRGGGVEQIDGMAVCRINNYESFEGWTVNRIFEIASNNGLSSATESGRKFKFIFYIYQCAHSLSGNTL